MLERKLGMQEGEFSALPSMRRGANGTIPKETGLTTLSRSPGPELD
jgi:hypothetical protein